MPSTFCRATMPCEYLVPPCQERTTYQHHIITSAEASHSSKMLLQAFTAALLGASSAVGWGTIVVSRRLACKLSICVPAALTSTTQAQTYNGKQCTGHIKSLIYDALCAPLDSDAAYVTRFSCSAFHSYDPTLTPW